MKIEKDYFNYTIYIVKEYLDYYGFDFSNNATHQIKGLFNKINDKFNLNLEGFYEVIVYLNDVYGIIIEMEKDEEEYVKIFNDKLDMKIVFKFDSEIYYENDMGNFKYNDKLYSKNPNYESNIIYGNKLKNISKLNFNY